MTRAQVGALGLDAARERVCARGVEEPVAHHGAEWTGRDHRLGDEAVDGAEDPGAIDAHACHDRHRRIDREMADEHGEPSQHRALEVRQQLVAPIQRRLQGLLARRRGARPLPEQSEPLIEQSGSLREAISLDASCRQLDRQRHPVELPADARHDRRVGIAEREARSARRRALEKELDRRKGLRGRRGEPGIVRRTSERFQPVDVLALDTQGLATGRQDVDLRRGREDALRQRGNRLDQMLAGIEDQQPALIAQVGEQARHRIVGLHGEPEHRADDRSYQSGVAHHAEIDEQHIAGERLDQIMSDRRRHRALADAAGANDRDEARTRQLRRDRRNVTAAADHAEQSVGEVRVRDTAGDPRPRRGALTRPRDRRDETIAASRKRRDVADAVLAVAQRLAQARDVEAQAAFLHRHVGPDPGQQLPLADDLVGAGDERNQNIERARAEFHRRAVPREPSLTRDQAEGTERYDVSRLRCRPRHGVFVVRRRPTSGARRSLRPSGPNCHGSHRLTTLHKA